MPSSLPPEALAELKRRHLAFLEARLVSPRAAEEWRAHAAGVHQALLAARVGDVIDARALADALDAALTGEAVERAARPVAKRLLPLVLRELRTDDARLGDRVPAATRKKIDALLERKGLLPERFLREVVEQEAVDEVMRDVLYDGLKEFSEKVNPFTAEWGIPSLLKRLSVLGAGLGKGLDSVRAEFDRRLEPEIRKFLAGFSRRGLRGMVDATITRSDLPKSVALRKHLAAWLLEQQLGDLMRGADEETIALGQEIGLDIAAAELGREALRARRRALIEEAIAAVKDQTVGEALAGIGVTLVPDLDAIAAATWPVVRAAMASPAVQGWLAGIVGEFYDAEAASG
jgi:hypothetical protein